MNTRALLTLTLSLSLSLGLLGCAGEKDPAEDDTTGTATTGDTTSGDVGGPGVGGDDTAVGDDTDTSGDDGGTDGGTDDGGTDDGGTDDGGTDDGGTVDDTGSTSDMEQGPDDWYAGQACDLFLDVGETVQAASSQGDAGQALITPSENTVYQIERSAEGDAYITLEVPDWHVELRVFANPGTTYEIYKTGGSGSVMLNGACPDEGISDQQWTIHDWGSYVIRFDASSPEPIYFAVMEES